MGCKANLEPYDESMGCRLRAKMAVITNVPLKIFSGIDFFLVFVFNAIHGLAEMTDSVIKPRSFLRSLWYNNIRASLYLRPEAAYAVRTAHCDWSIPLLIN